MPTNLSKLSFVSLRRRNLTPALVRRHKLATHIQEQIALAKAMLSGDKFTPRKRQWQLTSDGGKELIEVERRIKPWWYIHDDGQIILTVRWGSRLIEFQRGRAGIIVADQHEIPNVLGVLLTAVNAGEFDILIENANMKMKESSVHRR